MFIYVITYYTVKLKELVYLHTFYRKALKKSYTMALLYLKSQTLVYCYSKNVGCPSN